MKRKTHIKFRNQFSEKMMELGNIVAGSLIFGQFLYNKEFSLLIFTLGLILTIIYYIISYLIIK